MLGFCIFLEGHDLALCGLSKKEKGEHGMSMSGKVLGVGFRRWGEIASVVAARSGSPLSAYYGFFKDVRVESGYGPD